MGEGDVEESVVSELPTVRPGEVLAQLLHGPVGVGEYWQLKHFLLFQTWMVTVTQKNLLPGISLTSLP